MADFEKYTVGWVCALSTEFTAAKVMLDETHPNVQSVPPRDSNGYVLGKIGSHNVVIAVLPDSEYGLSSAANVATNMLNMFPNIRIGLLVGIGGGAPTSQKDIRLGDVAVSSIGHGTGGVFQYDYGRTVQNQEFQTTGFLSQPPTVLRVAISAIKSEHEMNGHHIQDSIHDGLQRYPRLKKKYSRPPTVNDRLYLSSVVHPFKDHRSCDEACGEGTMDEPKLVKRHERSEEDDDPEIHYGIIASGNQLMKDAHVRDKLSSERGIVCFEMEAAGLLNNFPCVVIRGICDYADTHKNDEWQGYAAMTAAAYAKELLKQVSVTGIQEERRISDVLCDLHTTIKSISSRVQGQDQVLSQIKDRAEMHQDRATIDRLPYVKEATFDSHNEDQNPTCLENTRVDLLAQISAWVEDADSKTVFWLNGMAGTGKSTISRTVTRSLSTTGKLGASFFFKRGEADQGSAAKLCTTMARQMAVNNACFGSLLRSAIDKDPEIGSKGMRIQFEKLILQPLSNMYKQQSVDMTTIAIAVDALDECNSERDIKLLISLFSQAGKLSNVRLRVFLTSRPELPIRLIFNSVLGTFQDLILHEIPAPVIRHDISVFFQHQLKNILLEWNSSVAEHRRLPEIWPDEDDIQTLIDQAVPLFIFAATMCRFIADRNSGPRTRLREILQYATWKDADKMQATYAPVLDQLLIGLSPADRKVALDEFKLIIGTIIILESRLSAMVLSRLLGISQDRVDDRLDKLHSVLDVPKSPEVPIRLFHLSFRDYLIDGKYPDNEFRIDQKEASRRLSTNCLRVMRTYLKTDICNLRHPGTERVNISGQLVDSCLPPELQYACLYWVKHQQGSDVKLDDIQLIMEFIKTHLLHWIEALVLMNRSWEISGLFKILRGLLKHNSSSFEFLSDALQFINYSISTVDTHPLQLYSHGLVFAPQNSLVKSNFEAQMPMWIKQAPSTGPDWDTRLHIFMKPDYHVFHSMSFIPESTLLFVSLESGSFDILDWDTGECLHEFRNISKLCAAVLSPDGKFIAAPSCENRIEIRDSLTSEILFKFPGRCDIDVELLFSPNSRLIAVSGEGTIHIWDWASSTHLYRLEKRHSGVKRINRIAFSADSVLVMSSSDLEIAIWNCQTGDCNFK
ncbi:WD domain protein [Fusarium oxysporum f. sp. albedinis]|nr:WD domain protein [Fusarium oxysporum f. sp. albedinis]KAK2474592.1 hypothetical protein H9L39_14552 [Fusarium oxysporum f. sp. albedinis]